VEPYGQILLHNPPSGATPPSGIVTTIVELPPYPVKLTIAPLIFTWYTIGNEPPTFLMVKPAANVNKGFGATGAPPTVTEVADTKIILE
jgi:hypothetical protein